MLLRPIAISLTVSALALLPGCAKETREGDSGGTVQPHPASGGDAAETLRLDDPGTGGTPGTGGADQCPPPSTKRYECAEVRLEAPPPVTLRFAQDPWDADDMSGTITPGTYVLTDLIQNGQKAGCSRAASAVLVFGTDGKMAYRWDEAGVSSTFTASYTKGQRDGTVIYTVDCPKSIAGQKSGLAFQTTATGFTMTYADGAVQVFTRKP